MITDYTIRDNILMPHQLQIVDTKSGDILATVNTAGEPGRYVVAALFIGFDKLGLRVKDETHVVSSDAP